MTRSFESLRVTRREFLGTSAVAASGLLLASDPALADDIYAGLPTFAFRARRGRDLLDLEFRFVNFTLQGDELVALGGGDSRIVVRFPPQNLGEAAFTDPAPGCEEKIIPHMVRPEGGSATPTEPLAQCRPPVEAYLSGPSWIAFRAPDLIRMPLGVCGCSATAEEAAAKNGPGAAQGVTVAHATSGNASPTQPSVQPAAVCRQCGEPFASPVDRWLQMMGDWQVRVPRAALASGSEEPRVPIAIPTEDETSIEIPFRLMIAPTTEDVGVLTSSERLPYDSVDVRLRGRTFDLWHAAVRSRRPIVPTKPPAELEQMMQADPDLKPPAPARITLQAKALYTPDYIEGVVTPTSLYYPDSRELSLRAITRRLLVEQMAAGDGIIDAENLILTALGGNANLSYTTTKDAKAIIEAQLAADRDGLRVKQFDADGKLLPESLWLSKRTKGETEGTANEPNDPALTLAIWRHRIVIGRDVFYVQAFYGFLMPMTYPSLYVEVTQRSLAALRRLDGASLTNNSGPPGAYLLTRRYILIQDPRREYPDAESTFGRMMPIKKAVLEEMRSPFLLAPQNVHFAAGDCDQGELAVDPGAGIDLSSGFFFIPRRLSDGRDVRWKMMFEDGAGRQSRTDDACLLFATNVVIGQLLWEKLCPKYRRWQMPAQEICYAPQQPEIIVRSDEFSKVKTLTPAQISTPRKSTDGKSLLINDVAFLHRLADIERKAARMLGDVLRAWVAAVNGVQPKLDRLKKLATSTLESLAQDADTEIQELVRLFNTEALPLEDRFPADELIGRLKGIADGTIQAIGQAAAAIEANVVAKKQQAIEAVLQQLGRCEQVSTALETHVIEFGCAKVSEAFSDLTNIKQKILAINESDVAQTIQEAKAAYAALTDPNLKQQIERQLDTMAGAFANDAIGPAKAVLIKQVEELKLLQKKAEQMGVQHFQAMLHEAEVAVPALKAISSQSAKKAIGLLEDYALQGISQVQNGLYARLKEPIDEGKAMIEQVKSGLAAPAGIVQGLARDIGAVVAESQEQFEEISRPLQEAGIDLKKAIPDAKLFGVIPLRALVGLLAKDALPAINLLKTPLFYEHICEWVLKLQPDYTLPPLKLVIHKTRPENRLRILLKTRVDFGKPTDVAAGRPPQGRVTLDGFLGPWDELRKKEADKPDVEAFRLVLADLVAAKFTALRVHASYLVGEDVKPDVKPGFQGVEFLGPLQFLNDFEKWLVFGGGFRIEVSPIQIGVRYDLPIPPLSFGAFSLQNIKLGTALLLPLELRALRFEFNFSSWPKPFELTVMCLGGRGFFRAALQSDGLRELEGAIEFGGSLSFSVAVASGGLYIMAGGYFRIDNSSTVLAGYVRAGGYLDVLGLITASVEFLLMLCYRRANDQNQMYGIARVTVSINIIFVIDVDVTVEMEQTILGSSDKAHNSQGSAGDIALSAPMRVRSMFASSVGRASALLLASSGTGAGPAAKGAPAAPAAPPTNAPACYFDRNCCQGRFAWNIESWNRAYWSQYDLSCN